MQPEEPPHKSNSSLPLQPATRFCKLRLQVCKFVKYFVNKVLLEHSHVHLQLWLLSCYDIRAVKFQKRPMYDYKLKIFTIWSCKKKCANLCCKEGQ